MKKILLIEDDIVLRENTAELLELSDYEVATASNGKIGVELAIKNTPDIIICDIMMPELDGYGVLEALSKNKNTKYLPFIFLSAKTERKDIRKGMDLGADDYITKPFGEEELVNAIESRLAKAAILKDERNNKPNVEINQEDEVRTLEDLTNFFKENGEFFSYQKSSAIYKEGGNSNFIYLLTKGVVKCYKFDEKGQELTTSLYEEGNLFGYTSFAQNLPHQETAQAIKDTELIGVKKSEFKDMLNNNHKVTLALIELLTDNITGIKNQLLEMAYSSAHKKTANTILKFAEKMNRKSEDSIRISRSDLASVAGIATETLIRTMSSFKKQGLIEIEGRTIKIIDIQRLQSIY